MQRSGFYFPVGSQELVGKMYYFQEFLIYFNKSYGFMLFILICAYSAVRHNLFKKTFRTAFLNRSKAVFLSWVIFPKSRLDR